MVSVVIGLLLAEHRDSPICLHATAPEYLASNQVEGERALPMELIASPLLEGFVLPFFYVVELGRAPSSFFIQVGQQFEPEAQNEPFPEKCQAR